MPIAIAKTWSPSTSTYLHWKKSSFVWSIVKFLDTFSVFMCFFHAKAMWHAPTYLENHPFNTRRNARNAWGSDVGEAASAGTSRVESDDIWLDSSLDVLSSLFEFCCSSLWIPSWPHTKKKRLKTNPEPEYTSKPQQHSSTLNPYSVGTVVLHLNPTWSQGNGACGFKLVTWQTHGTPTWMWTMLFTKHVAILPHETT